MPESAQLLAPFSLADDKGIDVSFDGGQQTLLCFVKEDCPTCRTVIPVLKALFDAGVNILVIGQTVLGNNKLIEAFDLPFPILNDEKLKVSFAYDIETVPTLIHADKNGKQVELQEGFVKSDWQALTKSLVDAGTDIELDWDSLPDWRPGCGSLSVDPIIADKLRAEAETAH